jgi:xanthine dehydrogenase accessory factor
MNLLNEISKAGENKLNSVLCLVVQTSGSTPRKIGSKMLVYEDGSISGSIGGGNIEKKVIEQAIVQLQEGKPATFKYNLVKDLEMCCGGRMAIYFEPIMKKNKLYIFGAGHTGEALAKYAVNFKFDISLFDDRKEYLEKIKLDDVEKVECNFSKPLKGIECDAQTYVVIMTYNHQVDREVLSYFAGKELAYLGMIGSMRKIEVTKKMLRDEQKVTVQQINKIDMPIGIDIKVEEPEEIAISVLAKLIDVKNG